MGAQVQEALADVIGARRDIRRYRPDAVPDELVREVLAAYQGGGHVAQDPGPMAPHFHADSEGEHTHDGVTHTH